MRCDGEKKSMKLCEILLSSISRMMMIMRKTKFWPGVCFHLIMSKAPDVGDLWSMRLPRCLVYYGIRWLLLQVDSLPSFDRKNKRAALDATPTRESEMKFEFLLFLSLTGNIILWVMTRWWLSPFHRSSFSPLLWLWLWKKQLSFHQNDDERWRRRKLWKFIIFFSIVPLLATSTDRELPGRVERLSIRRESSSLLLLGDRRGERRELRNSHTREAQTIFVNGRENNNTNCKAIKIAG